ncbi:hypothetical protein GGX14DRAFT_386115 [Mycena pura]|uniref:Uncharacterized protein n=1 Tax=Mycena pura TaxID=153505 RepID=A0AAD6YRX1_9AGAR|nr:hypothetical protein GGX14DRAFT_386115 [Mycena pura]
MACSGLRDLENKVACNPNGFLSTHDLRGIEVGVLAATDITSNHTWPEQWVHIDGSSKAQAKETGLGFDKVLFEGGRWSRDSGEREMVVVEKEVATPSYLCTVLAVLMSGLHIFHTSLLAMQKRLKLRLNLSVINYIYPAHSPGGSSCSVHMAEGWQPFGRFPSILTMTLVRGLLQCRKEHRFIFAEEGGRTHHKWSNSKSAEVSSSPSSARGVGCPRKPYI